MVSATNITLLDDIINGNLGKHVPYVTIITVLAYLSSVKYK